LVWVIVERLNITHLLLGIKVWLYEARFIFCLPYSHSCREVEKPEKATQQAVPQTNHVHITQNSSQSQSLRMTDREEPQDNGIRLAHGNEGRYGLETQGKPSQSAPQERVERLSPDSVNDAAHKNGQQTVIQVALPPEQNGNVVYQRGFVSRTDTEKHVQRKNTLAQVEQWVKVHKGDAPKRSVSLIQFILVQFYLYSAKSQQMSSQGPSKLQSKSSQLQSSSV